MSTAAEKQPLVGYDRVVVSTLMPLSLMWEDFLQQHEFISNDVPMLINPDNVMKLIAQMNGYVQSVYKRIDVSQEQWDEIASQIVPIMYKGGHPVPNSTQDHEDKNEEESNEGGNESGELPVK